MRTLRVGVCSVLEYIYIYIYSHLQTDCFILSEFFSVARHAGHSKPVQLYVRLCFRPLGHQADHVGKGNFKVFLFLETAAAFVYIFLNTLSATRVFNSLYYSAADNSFARELNPHGNIYIYICVCVCVCVCVCSAWIATDFCLFSRFTLSLSLKICFV